MPHAVCDTRIKRAKTGRLDEHGDYCDYSTRITVLSCMTMACEAAPSMDANARLEFFKSLHEAQIERGQRFADPIRTLVTGLSFVFALLGYFCAKFEPAGILPLVLFGVPV